MPIFVISEMNFVENFVQVCLKFLLSLEREYGGGNEPPCVALVSRCVDSFFHAVAFTLYFDQVGVV